MGDHKHMSDLAALLDRHCHRDLTPSAIPRVLLSRSPVATPLTAVMYHPLFCVLARGRKRVLLGDKEFSYDAGTYLIASAELPVSGQIIEGPCLGVMLTLEPARLATLLREMPPVAKRGRPAPAKAVGVNRLGNELLEALLKLLRLLDRPEHIPVLAPMAEREVLYHLLLGPQGAILRQLAQPESRLSQVGRAIEEIRRRYDEPLRAEELARCAAMSIPSFHRHFRAVTAMSPLQFQKCVRLHEARRMLLAQDGDAARVSFEVGYESASQFSREYRRLFGEPPGRDVSRARRKNAPE